MTIWVWAMEGHEPDQEKEHYTLRIEEVPI